MEQKVMDIANQRMSPVLENCKKELAGLRTGRASPELLEHVVVEVYGVKTPLNQVANVTVIDSRMLGVQVWDSNNVKLVENAIREAPLGLNPSADGSVVRVPLPSLSGERRQELVKAAEKFAEHARVSVRNIRRDLLNDLKQQEKNKQISEDEMHRLSNDIQKITDKWIGEVDKLLAAKSADILKT